MSSFGLFCGGCVTGTCIGVFFTALNGVIGIYIYSRQKNSALPPISCDEFDSGHFQRPEADDFVGIIGGADPDYVALHEKTPTRREVTLDLSSGFSMEPAQFELYWTTFKAVGEPRRYRVTANLEKILAVYHVRCIASGASGSGRRSFFYCAKGAIPIVVEALQSSDSTEVTVKCQSTEVGELFLEWLSQILKPMEKNVDEF